MPLFHENTDTVEFDQFIQNMPRGSVSVCGKTYKCQSTSSGDVYWSSDPKSDGHTSRDCNVDMLVAAAHANNCNVSRQYKSIPTDCIRENPILVGANGTAVQVRDAATYDMPSLVEAHWKCVPKGSVGEHTHNPSHVEDLGGVALLHLSTDETQGANSQPPRHDTQQSEPAPDHTRNSCSIASREQKRACSIDSDCPIMDDRLNDMLLAKTRELNIDMSRGLSNFMKALRDTLSQDLKWTDTNAQALERDSRTESGVKSSIGILLDTDSTFRNSVRSMIEGDPDFSGLRESARSGSCTTQGRCIAATVVPTSRVYDGSNDVTFSMLDDRVMYTRNGLVREANAVKCIGEQKSRCNAVSDVIEGRDSITLSGEPVSSAYRLRFAGVDSEYMVVNNVHARDDTDCPIRLCEHNTGSCPSDICQLTDEKRCVPK